MVQHYSYFKNIILITACCSAVYFYIGTDNSGIRAKGDLKDAGSNKDRDWEAFF